ncbi:MAG: VWA domain-containing protein [Acidobacteria bacterium]|nr:VWA domain-containing protein [Acidobacteriota bacterium]
MRRRLGAVLTLALALAAQQADQGPTFRVTSRLIVVNVEVHDKAGKSIDSLRRDDFTLLENGKEQQVSVFEYQSLPVGATSSGPEAVAKTAAPAAKAAQPQSPLRYKDRRLIVLFFDLSSMAIEDQFHAQEAAREFITKKMTPADLVAVMTFSNRVKVAQEFTPDRDRLLATIESFSLGEAADLAGAGDTGDEASQDTGDAFTADDTEFNLFNTDRKLSALESAAKMLGALPEKKALIYFSSGVGKTGVENQSQLRSAVNAAIRSNVAFYPIDVRGLVAEAPGGDARQASTRGSSMYSGGAQRQRGASFSDQQETLSTLAADTGGKALLDNNDLALGIVRAQEDISSYYILGYYSNSSVEDGKYRKIEVKLNAEYKAKLSYRAGYYAPKAFRKFTASDREQQLEEALMLDDPVTDLPLALEINYFRRAADRYIVPLAVKIPGSEIALAHKKNREETQIDFIGQVRNTQGRMVGALRDNILVKFTGMNLGALAQRQLQYDAAFTLPPGDYKLKFLVRENETGKMGTFETKFTVPDLQKEQNYLHLSSVVWANQREKLSEAVGTAREDRKTLQKHPLVKEGYKLIPSISRVFRQDQSLFVYLEVYPAGGGKAPAAPDILASVSVFRGRIKAFESKPVALTAEKGSKGLFPVEIELPLATLGPGDYTAQVNVINRTDQKFAFRRAPLFLLPKREGPRKSD